MRRYFLLSLLVLLVTLFAVSLFKNISYPLIWGDEGNTVMYAVRILEYGYPKVNDEKNILSLIEIPNWPAAVREPYGIYIGTPWLQYYYSTIGVFFASTTSDFYQKTAFLRVPFAFAGFVGVIILSFMSLFLFKDDLVKKLIFLTLFYILALVSISLVLHLREARYYSLTILLSSFILSIFTKYHFSSNKLHFGIYCGSIIIFTLLLLNTFVPIYMIFMLALGSYLFFCLLLLLNKNQSLLFFLIDNKNSTVKQLVRDISPLVMAGIFSIPFVIFYNMPSVSSVVWKDINYNFNVYLNYLLRIIKFLTTYHFLALALVVKFFLFVFLRSNVQDDSLHKKEEFKGIIEKVRVSNFLTYFIFIYIVFIAITPFMFDRYFILLQPVLSIVIILDSFIIFESVRGHRSREIILYTLSVIFILSMVTKMDLIKGHFYELTHQYKGPLDYIVYFIKENFKNPENLTIATNHEETSYIYYLDSRIYTDYGNSESEVNKNLKPDLVIPRKYMMTEPFLNKVNKLLSEGGYKKFSFPIYDYPANNIPELSISLHHLFETKLATNDSERVDLYINEK